MCKNRNAICSYLINLFWCCDVRPAQFLIGIASIGWALMLAWPGETFERQTYAMMAVIGHELAWAAMFLFVGFTNLHNVVAEFFRPWPTLVSKFDAFITAVVWITAVVAILLAQSPPPAAIAGEIALAVAAFWLFVRSDLPLIKRRRSTDA